MRRVSPFGHLRITACLVAPRSLSHPTTSFIAYLNQGIHYILFVTLIFYFAFKSIIELSYFVQYEAQIIYFVRRILKYVVDKYVICNKVVYKVRKFYLKELTIKKNLIATKPLNLNRNECLFFSFDTIQMKLLNLLLLLSH